MIIRSLIILIFSFVFTQHFEVTLNVTGESHLVIFQESITGLDIGDEIGIFDANGVLVTDSSGNNPQYGEVNTNENIRMINDLIIINKLLQHNSPLAIIFNYYQRKLLSIYVNRC
jgi:hypothetical protein